MLKKIILFFAFVLSSNSLFSESSHIDDIFSGYNSDYVSGYLKPIFTSLGQGMNSNFYTKTNYAKDEWRFGLDISGNAMMVPDGQKTFTPAVPKEWLDSNIAYLNSSGNTVYKNFKTMEQPTFYGGKSNPLFATDSLGNSSLVRTYLEGINLNNVSVLPNIQFVIGLPTQTEIRLRGFGGGGSMSYGFIVNQRIDEYGKIFGKENNKQSLGINVAYQGTSFEFDDKDPGTRDLFINMEMSTFAFGVNYGYNIANNFNLYTGLQYETLSGNLVAIYTDNSGFSSGKENTINADITSYTSIRALAGLSYKLSFAEFHIDGIYASQPMFTAGLTFHFGSWGKKEEAPKTQETKTEPIK